MQILNDPGAMLLVSSKEGVAASFYQEGKGDLQNQLMVLLLLCHSCLAQVSISSYKEASFQFWDGETSWESFLGWLIHSKHCGFNPNSLAILGKTPGLLFSHISQRHLSLCKGCDCW